MPTREQLTQERLDALLSMMADDGRKPPGKVDLSHIETLKNTGEFGEGRKVAKNHREGNPPPELDE